MVVLSSKMGPWSHLSSSLLIAIYINYIIIVIVKIITGREREQNS
jgi:hypothetical protein